MDEEDAVSLPSFAVAYGVEAFAPCRVMKHCDPLPFAKYAILAVAYTAVTARPKRNGSERDPKQMKETVIKNPEEENILKVFDYV